MSGVGPTPTTSALQQVVGYLGYTCHRAKADATAAFDPNLSYTWLRTRPQFGSEGQSLGGQASLDEYQRAKFQPPRNPRIAA